MNETQEKIVGILTRHSGMHFLGDALARMVGISARTLRTEIRRLRFDAGRSDILSRAGDDPATDGYWISTDKKEIEENRRYHEAYGKGAMARAGRMTPARSQPVAQAAGQQLMELQYNEDDKT